MNRKEFVNAVAEKNEGLTKKAVAKVVADVLDTIKDAVADGDVVAFQGFGSFKAVDRAARTGHNPKTGDTINIPATKAPKFTAGKDFKDAVRK